MINTDINFQYLQHLNELDVIFNAMTEPILVYNEKGVVMKINDAGIISLGFDPTGLHNHEIAKKVSLHMIDGKKTEIEDIISNRVLKGEVIKDFIFVIKTPSGEEKIYHCSASPIKMDGRVTGAITTWHDIKQDKKKESLYNSELKMFMNILDSIQDGIYICNKDYTIEYANPTTINKLGDPVGKKCYEYLYKRSETCPWCKNPEVFSGKTVRWEWYDPESGKTYDLIDTPFYNSDGSISKLKIFHDITDGKEKEKSLDRDKRELLNKVDEINIELEKKTADLEDKSSRLNLQSNIIDKFFANTQFLIALLDTDLNFIRVNKAYAMADGKDELFFIGKNHFDLYPHEENEAIFTNVLKTGESYITYAKAFTYPYKPELGITYWDWSLNPIKDEDGDVTGLILILLDVTDRKKIEIELNEAKRLSDIGALATTVAHELRSPLGVIQGTVYNVMRKNRNEKLLNNMRRIERKVDESEKIINNLLNYSRIKRPELKKIHFYNFMNEFVNDTKRQYSNTKENLTFSYDSFKEITLNIDPFQIREVLSNIINNAYQAFPENQGHIEILGYMESELCKIDIKDNGEGIDKEDIEKIFEPFFTKKSKGTGLGLTICRELIHLNKGNIEIDSEKGQGTVVHISLPLEICKE